jgi:hypothetical protein
MIHPIYRDLVRLPDTTVTTPDLEPKPRRPREHTKLKLHFPIFGKAPPNPVPSLFVFDVFDSGVGGDVDRRRRYGREELVQR